jgi:hypothetical protein
MEPPVSTLSYQEKSLYGTLAADLIVYVPYFLYVMHHPTTLAHIVGTIVLLILAQIVLQAGIAIASRSRITDERDREIAALGYRSGYFTLVGLMITGMGLLWLHTIPLHSTDNHAAIDEMVCANAPCGGHVLNPNHMGLHFLSVFLGMIVIAELVKITTQLVAYRRTV